MPAPKLLCVLLASCLMACDDGPTPPVVPQPAIELGPGMANVLPHQQEGTEFPLKVLVTIQGAPAAGVKVFWDDGRRPTYLSTRESLTDADGIAQTTWNLPYLPAAIPWYTYSAQAALPGAAGNPIDFTIEVYRCTKC